MIDLTFSKPVILIGGGPVDAGTLAMAQQYSDVIIAVDSGADQAEAIGLPLTAIIGDLDSVSGQILDKYAEIVRHIAEQDSTDFEKCLRVVEAPLYICIGFLDGQLGHTLAALNALAKNAEKRIVLVSAEDVTLLCPKAFDIDLPADTRVSLFPLGAVPAVSSGGLKWELQSLDLKSEGQIGTSNRMVCDQLSIRYDAGKLLLILPRDVLPAVIAAV